MSPAGVTIEELFSKQRFGAFKASEVPGQIIESGFKSTSLQDLVHPQPQDENETASNVLSPADNESHENENIEVDANTGTGTDEASQQVSSEEAIGGVTNPSSVENSESHVQKDDSGQEKNKIPVEGKEEIYQEGYRAGLAATESATEEELSNAISSFQSLTNELMGEKVFDSGHVEEYLVEKIKQIASHLAGHYIDEIPEEFYLRIKKEIEKLNFIETKKIVYLNQDDLEIIRKHMEQFPNLANVEFLADDKMSRGGIKIVVGNMIYEEL